MNSIMVIRPYKYDEIWVFDDEKVGLVREPFVAGADKIIDRLVANIQMQQRDSVYCFLLAHFPVIK